MIDKIIEDAVRDMVVTEVTNDLGPFIIVGFLSLVMFVGYHICSKAEEKMETIRTKRKVRKNA